MKRLSTAVPIRTRIWEMYKHRCLLCGRFMKLQDVTIDHILPKSLGGRNRIENYAPAHAKCNQKKSSTVNQKHIIRGLDTARKYSYSVLPSEGRRAKLKAQGKLTLEDRWMTLFGEPLPEKYLQRT